MDAADMHARVAGWGGSGLAWLTGMPAGTPDFSRSAVLGRAQRVADDIGRHTGLSIDAASTLAGRAALLGLRRRGRIAAGGATRLLAGTDGWCAITLSRPDDVQAVPALMELSGVATEPWSALQDWVPARSVAVVVERAHLLGIPAAVLGEAPATPPRVRRTGPAQPSRGVSDLLVADLSSMWAGPLCASLLARAGATVVKVESPGRPDGTRAGPRAFFDWMHSGKLCYAVDFETDARRVRELLASADVVIEGSRPAALTRRGLGPGDIPARPGRVWLRITGHGTDGGNAERVAFGDDAAVAGGLVGRGEDGPVFCGDAIADPLTGLESALAVAESLARGGGELIEVSMAAVASTYAALPTVEGGGPVTAPRRPPRCTPAGELGADNAAVQRVIAERRCAAC